MSDGPDVERILVQYEDGSTKEITKGFIGATKDDGETMKLEFINMSGPELQEIMMGLLQFAAQMVDPKLLEDDENEVG